LLGGTERPPRRLRTFWCKRISLISLIPCNDPAMIYNYVLHDTLILAVRPTLGCQISHVVPQASNPAVTSDAGCGRITPNG
jgi:hypothetical protein